MKLFIDGDSILFKAALVTQNNFDTRDSINTIIKRIQAHCWATETYIAIKGFKNFRYDIFPDYKKNRKDAKPLEEDVRERLNHAYFYIKDKFGAVAADGMEADDLVCIWCHEAREAEEPFVVSHIDKDLNQIAGTHHNYNKEIIYQVSDDEADMNFCVQLLIGDSGDGIPQLKRGLGPKGAEKLLAGTTYDNRINEVIKAYKMHYGKGWEERLNLIGNLLWMKRTFSKELEWNYEDRYEVSDKGKADVSEQDGSDKSDTDQDREIVHADVPDPAVQGLS